MKVKKIIYYLYIFGIMCSVPFVVSASNIGIAVDQNAIVFDVDTGESQEFIVEVKNISNEKQEIEVSVMDYVLGDNNVMTLLNENDDNNGIKEWINIRDKNIVLESGGAQEVVFDVKTPESASIGSHKGAVIFRVMPRGDDTVKVQGQIGVHVLINVRGDTHASGHINKFDIHLLALGPVEYAAEFENTGNIHYVPYGEVVVRNVFTKNEQLYKYDKHFVFPGKKFTFSHVEQIPSLFGLYKARVAFVDGEGVTRMKVDYTMGYLFPLVFVVILGVVIIVLRWVIVKNKSKKKKEVSQDKKFQIKIKK